MNVDQSHDNGTPGSDFEASAVRDEQADLTYVVLKLTSQLELSFLQSVQMLYPRITHSPNQNLVLFPSTTELLCTNRLALGHDLEKTT
jgi:hypothetical protein